MCISDSVAGTRHPLRVARRAGATLLCGLVLSTTALADPIRVSDFSLLDHEGKFQQLSYYGDQNAVVIVVQASGDQWFREQLPALHEIQAAWQARGVQFFMLNPTPEVNREAVQREANARAYGMPVLLDEAQLVAEALRLERVGELLVIDPQRMTLLYRGALGATTRTDLEAILGAQTSDQAVDALVQGVQDSKGARLTFPGRDLGQISYTGDIVPILEDNCVSCHHDGGIGPWSMNSHAMVRGFGPMIKEVITTRRMPPGQIDTHVGRPISNAAGLSIEDQQKLIRWIDEGSPIDGETDPLTALTFDDQKFTLGEPDLVYKVPAQELPATGTVDYRYVPVQLNLDRDVWISGMEFVPGDHKALHHVIAYLQSPADRRKRSHQSVAAQGESVGGFAPGRQADSFGEHGGRLIPKGSSLLLQMHYTTYGKATVDETEFGIYLHDAPPRWVMNEAVASQRRFVVPPYEKEHKLEGEFLVERDAYLHAMMPHMHYRGKYMSYSAIYPDGGEELLMSVPRYDFNWQFNYQLAEPVLLPAGTRLVARGAMDNSDRNPGNPDPSRPVYYGLQTTHEMFFGFTTVRYLDREIEDPGLITLPTAERQPTQGIASK